MIRSSGWDWLTIWPRHKRTLLFVINALGFLMSTGTGSHDLGFSHLIWKTTSPTVQCTHHSTEALVFCPYGPTDATFTGWYGCWGGSLGEVDSYYRWDRLYITYYKNNAFNIFLLFLVTSLEQTLSDWSTEKLPQKPVSSLNIYTVPLNPCYFIHHNVLWNLGKYHRLSWSDLSSDCCTKALHLHAGVCAVLLYISLFTDGRLRQLNPSNILMAQISEVKVRIWQHKALIMTKL